MEKKKFIVSVSETLNRLVAVEAESYDKARELVLEAWEKGTIVLDKDDSIDDWPEISLYTEHPYEYEIDLCKNFIDGRGLE